MLEASNIEPITRVRRAFFEGTSLHYLVTLLTNFLKTSERTTFLNSYFALGAAKVAEDQNMRLTTLRKSFRTAS